MAAWLVTDFLPHMTVAGIEHVAWIQAPALPGLHMLQTIINWLPGSTIASFRDIVDAVAWLQHTRTGQRESLTSGRSPTLQAQVEQAARSLQERVAAKRSKQPKSSSTQRVAA